MIDRERDWAVLSGTATGLVLAAIGVFAVTVVIVGASIFLGLVVGAVRVVSDWRLDRADGDRRASARQA